MQASHRLIEALEFYYLKPDQSVAVLPLVRQPQKDQAGQRWYQAEVPPKDSPQDFFRYALLAHSPLGPAGDVNDFITVPILSYDKGIALESTIVNGDSILWRWNGPTVAMGSKFQLWAGDEMLAETVEDHVIVPAGACQKYQIVQLKVRVNPGADHPYAGQWSLPSAPFEAYAGQDGPIHEKEGIELMLSCLEQKALASLNQVVQGESLYQAGHDLYLEKALYYLSKIVWPQQAAQIDFGNYRFLYSILRFVSDQESQDYAKSTDKLPRSLLHKLVFQFNHGQNLDERFADSLQEMSLRMKGHPSI